MTACRVYPQLLLLPSIFIVDSALHVLLQWLLLLLCDEHPHLITPLLLLLLLYMPIHCRNLCPHSLLLHIDTIFCRSSSERSP